MLQSIFLVPFSAIFLFFLFGNSGRKSLMALHAPISLFFILCIGGPKTLALALLLIAPAFCIKEIQSCSKSKIWGWIGICLTLLSFVLFKDYFTLGTLFLESTFLGDFTRFLQAVGLSFIIFRSLEYLIIRPNLVFDKFPDKNLLSRLNKYLAFCLSFPTFTSGPILRWHTFNIDFEAQTPIFEDNQTFKRALRRIGNGFIKISFLSQPMLLLVLGTDSIAGSLGVEPINYLCFMFIATLFYLVFLYLNFSAYTDVMIGSGKLIGLRLPENFDKPFSTNNFLDFWSHWHLSVSLWFRDLVFTPIVKFFIIRGVKSNFFCSALAYFVTFGILGLWHGRTWPFLLCGFMLAFGALYNQSFRQYVAPWLKNTIYKTVGLKNTIIYLGRANTYLYIALAIMGLWLKPDNLTVFWKTLISWDGLVISACIIVLLAVILWILDLVKPLILYVALESPISRIWGTNRIWASALKVVVAIAFWQWVAVPTGSFVYEGF